MLLDESYEVRTHWGWFRLDRGAYEDYLTGKLWITWIPGKPKEQAAEQQKEDILTPNVTDHYYDALPTLQVIDDGSKIPERRHLRHSGRWRRIIGLHNQTPFGANTLLWTLKYPERSEPLGFGHPRVFLVFPFIYAVFREPPFSMGIGHTKEKSSKSKRGKKKLYDLNPLVRF